MPATSAANIVPFPAPKTPAWQLGLDEVVVYCVGMPGCGELAEAVADRETKCFAVDSQIVDAAYSLVKLPRRVCYATMSQLKLPHRSVWVEHERGRQRRGIQAERNADGSILLRHVGRAGPRALCMPAAWSLLDVHTPAPEIGQEALLEKTPVADPERDDGWSNWFCTAFQPVRRDRRGMTESEYKNWGNWAFWDLAVLHVLFAGTASSGRALRGTEGSSQ